uniref:Uncharacterized protein n=1 Tax=Oryza sativa subsp. japonica TaxID=39947 RepID=Q69WI4_ORYSJ|nr:hypothetical protein [Oryza sativa Japonica Group]BAD32955.1 hypothetical protein [Oryza sativa Japonica Group]
MSSPSALAAAHDAPATSLLNTPMGSSNKARKKGTNANESNTNTDNENGDEGIAAENED